MKPHKYSFFLLGLFMLGTVLALSVAVLEHTMPVTTYARLDSPFARVPVALDEDALQELQFVLEQHNLGVVDTMIDKGKVIRIGRHRRVAVLDRYQTAVVVEVLEGAQIGKTVWVPPVFLAPDLEQTPLPDQP